MPEGKVGGGMGWEAHIESRVFDQVLVALLLQSKVRDADPGGQGGDPGIGCQHFALRGPGEAVVNEIGGSHRVDCLVGEEIDRPAIQADETGQHEDKQRQ